MIRAEYEVYQNKCSKKWNHKAYPLKKISLENIFNWKSAFIDLLSPISIITGKNGVGKSTFINALKQAYNLQCESQEFGILTHLSDYKITLENQENKELIIIDKKIVKNDFYLPTLNDFTFNSNIYIHFKNCTGSDMTNYRETLEQYDPIPLSQDLILKMKDILGKNIVLAEKIVDEENDALQYYRLKLSDGTIYDSYTMGSGEFYINQFLWALNDLNPESIVVIEELENYLHSEAQKKIIELIYKYSHEKKIQFILTTHSPTLIDHVKNPNRILIKTDVSSNIISINRCPNWLAKDVLGTNVDKKIEILVEDEKALSLVRTIISRNNPNMVKQLIFTNCKGNSDIKLCLDIIKRLNLESSMIIGIIDGDSTYEEEDSLIKLPGKEPPEKLMMSYSTHSYEKIALKLDIPREDVISAFENAQCLSDYHEWFGKVAITLGETDEHLWGVVTKLWCLDNPEFVNIFFEKFETIFYRLKS